MSKNGKPCLFLNTVLNCKSFHKILEYIFCRIKCRTLISNLYHSGHTLTDRQCAQELGSDTHLAKRPGRWQNDPRCRQNDSLAK